jgi:hypothetical protein
MVAGQSGTISVPQASLHLKDKLSGRDKSKARGAKLFLSDCINQGDLDATLVLCDYFIARNKPTKAYLLI